MVDASAVARVLGIATEYSDLRAGQVRFLPQRLLVIGQGSTASAGYTNTKFQALSSRQVGTVAGHGNPAHLVMRELMPDNGDGVGTIPVDVILLDDDGAAAAAAGSITPDATETAAAGTYKVNVGGVEAQFTIAKGVTAVTTKCAAVGEAIRAVSHMPVTLDYTYGDVTAAAGASNVGELTVTTLAVTSGAIPIPGSWTLTCVEEVASKGNFTLTNPNGVIVDEITMGDSPYSYEGDELEFVLTDAGDDATLGDTWTITVPVTAVDVESKWAGDSANDIEIAITDPVGSTTWTIVQPTGGATNPGEAAINAALAQIGSTWTTMIINCLNPHDETALDAFQVWGEVRWGELIYKPAIVFRGCNDATVAAATAVTSTRTDDRVNCQLVSPGSPNLPCVIAAREVARIVKVANNTPANNYDLQAATGLTPGDDADQWDHASRDAAVKAGSSTVEIVDGVVKISDVVTSYAPEGEAAPAYRYVCDIVKLQNCTYNHALRFASTNWAGKPLIADDEPTVNPEARKPKGAIAEIAQLVDSLADWAILTDRATVKASITASINSMNAKRLDTGVTYILAGNTSIISHTQKFGHYYPAPATV